MSAPRLQFHKLFSELVADFLLTVLLELLVFLPRSGVVWYFFLYLCHFTLIGSVVVRVHCIVVYLCGSILYRKCFVI